jgi:hypothetical protein
VDKDILVVTEEEAASPRAGSIVSTAVREGVPLYVA